MHCVRDALFRDTLMKLVGLVVGPEKACTLYAPLLGFCAMTIRPDRYSHLTNSERDSSFAPPLLKNCLRHLSRDVLLKAVSRPPDRAAL